MAPIKTGDRRDLIYITWFTSLLGRRSMWSVDCNINILCILQKLLIILYFKFYIIICKSSKTCSNGRYCKVYIF